MEVQIPCLIEENHARCTKQHAPTAVKSAKFRSNQTPADQSTVESVGQREDHREDHATRFHKV